MTSPVSTAIYGYIFTMSIVPMHVMHCMHVIAFDHCGQIVFYRGTGQLQEVAAALSLGIYICS